MNLLDQAAIEIFKPKENLKVSDWAAKHIFLPKEVTPYPGYFKPGFNRYLCEPLDQFGNKQTDRLTICFASQTGKTTLMHIGLLWLVTENPKPILYLMPSDQAARQISKERIMPMMEASAAVKKVLPDNPDNFTILTYNLKGCNVHLGGAGSAAKLASFPAAVVCFDECDKAAVKNQNEAGAIQLAANRIKAYGSSKLFVLASTPTIDDGAETITHHLKQSTNNRYFVPCPKCNHTAQIGFEKDKEEFAVIWDKITHEGETDITATAATARLVCPYCKHEIDDNNTKNKMVSSDLAAWKATNPLADIRHQGYHLNSLYSSYITIQEAARLFLEAKFTNQLQDFRNSFQALPWRHETEDTPDTIQLKELETEYSRGQIPENSFIILTADVQKYEFYFMVTAHDNLGAIHIVDHGRANDFDELNKIFNKYKADYAGVDSAYNTGFVLQNLARLGSKWLAIRGQQTMQGNLNITQVNAIDGRTEKTAVGTIRRFDVNNTHFKRILVKMRNQSIAGLGIYKNADNLLYRHLLSEVEVEKKDRNGRIAWEFKQVDRENHWFDCLNYAIALGYFFRKTTSYEKVDRPKDSRRKPLSERFKPQEL